MISGDDMQRLTDDGCYHIMRIREKYALGKIDNLRAISLLKYRQKILEERTLGEHLRTVKVLPEHEEREFVQISEWIEELENDSKHISESTPAAADQRISPLRWLGTPSSWERVYEALVDAELIDKSPTAWAKHFKSKTGDPMKPPKGGSAILGEAKEPEIKAAVALIRNQE